jgi:hypothetical protein
VRSVELVNDILPSHVVMTWVASHSSSTAVMACAELSNQGGPLSGLLGQWSGTSSAGAAAVRDVGPILEGKNRLVQCRRGVGTVRCVARLSGAQGGAGGLS